MGRCAIAAAVALGVVSISCGGDGALEASGTVEMVQVSCSFRTGGVVDARMVREGDRVSAGDTLALLDDTPLRLELSLREAELASARARLEMMQSGLRPQEVSSAGASMQAASARMEQAADSYRRMAELHEAGAVAQQQLDGAATELEVARQGFRQASAAASLAREGFRGEDVAAAEAALDAAQAGVDLARERLGYAVLTSPREGVVQVTHLESGEAAGVGVPVVTVAGTDTVEVMAWVPQSALGDLHPGMKVEVVSDSRPQSPFIGSLERISEEAEFTPSRIETREERASLVYEITCRVPNPEGVLKAGMPVTVRFPEVLAE